MNQHRQLKKAKLIELQDKRENTRRRALNTCRVIMPLIDPELTEIVEMEIATAATAMDDLVMQQANLLTLDSKIKTLEEALYG